MRSERRIALFLVGCVACASLCRCSCGAEPVSQVSVKLRVSPASLDFGTIPVGAAVHKTVALVNNGNAPFDPVDADAPVVTGDAFHEATPCALPLAPGSFCNVDIAFAPQAEGDQTGAFVVHVPDGDDLTVALSGHAGAAEVVVDPASLDFGSVDTGDSVTLSFTVENRGADEVDAPVAVTGPGFFVAGGARQDLALAAGQTATVSVSFSPSAGGVADGSAVLEICGAGCGPTVALTGTGVAPRIDVEPRTVDFGDVAPGSSASADLTVSNVGEGDLVVTAADVLADTAGVSVDAGALPLVLAAGDSATVTVTWAPAAARGALGATLQLVSNDPISPSVLIPVDGDAPGPAVELLPSAVNLGVLDAGDERTVDVVARSVGTVPADVTGVELEGASFTFDGAAPGATTLSPGESIVFTVRARASAADVQAGGAQGAVVVSAASLADARMPMSFLSGTTGCQPRAVEQNLNLGAISVGLGTVGTLPIENVGDAPCTGGRATPAAGFAFDAGFSFSALGAGTIPPGGTGGIDFAFHAADEGRASAFLSLEFDGQPAPLLVSATARGVLGTLVGEPPLIDYGELVQGCGGPTRTATFFNSSGEDVVVTGIALDPPTAQFTLQVPALPVTLPAGAAIAVPVTALTSTVGTFPGAVVATSDLTDASVRLQMAVTDANAPVTETFTAADISQVDVLFVVDNSGSMADKQAELAANFDAFINDAFTGPSSSVDFHIGVTTTGVLDGSGGPLVGAFLTRGTGDLANAFAQEANVGVNGAGIELGLEAMRRALDDDANTSHNAGFLRARAALSVILIGDEDDNGGNEVAIVDPSLLREVSTYVEFLHGLKGGALANTPVIVSTACTPGSCDRYGQMAQAFQGTILDVTDPTWGQQLSQIGAATFGLQRLFHLSTEPVASSVTVTVDGQATTAFTVQGSNVILDDDPPPDAQVAITYQAGCQ